MEANQRLGDLGFEVIQILCGKVIRRLCSLFFRGFIVRLDTPSLGAGGWGRIIRPGANWLRTILSPSWVSYLDLLIWLLITRIYSQSTTIVGNIRPD